MRDYGDRAYSKGLYGKDKLLPIGIPISIYIWDRNGTFKGILSTNSNKILKVIFKHTKKGCGEFTIEFADAKDILKGDKIALKIFNSDKFFYRGVVRNIPIDGSTSNIYEYSGFGLNDYFVRMNAETYSYANKTLAYILNDRLDKIITLKSIILKDLSKVIPPNITVTKFDINYSQESDVLDALKKIADSSGTMYNYGVDSDGYFYFLPDDTTLKATLVVGKKGKYGIDKFEPTDEKEARTKLFVLRNDGTLYTTLIASGSEDIFEEKIKGPILNDADLLLWATGYLLDKESSNYSASIVWPISDYPDLIIADGNIRVISHIPEKFGVSTLNLKVWNSGFWGRGLWGGYKGNAKLLDETLAIKEIEYSITSDGAIRNITLGELPVKLENMIANINKKLADLEISIGV